MAISTKYTDDELIERFLEPDPNTGDPAEWLLKERGVHIWVLAAIATPDWSNAAQLAEDYEVSEEAIAAARA